MRNKSLQLRHISAPNPRFVSSTTGPSAQYGKKGAWKAFRRLADGAIVGGAFSVGYYYNQRPRETNTLTQDDKQVSKQPTYGSTKDLEKVSFESSVSSYILNHSIRLSKS